MILCLDVGNSQIYGGVFAGEKLLLKFRHDSRQSLSSDQIGVFLSNVLEANGINKKEIAEVAFCSVVPSIDYSLRSACIKYLGKEVFQLKPGVKTGLKINYRNPLEVGADRIANSIAALHKFPNKNIIVVDFGTATTICCINSKREYLGGVIAAGLRLSMEALQTKTAKLYPVEIVRPESIIGRSTTESLQSGLYYSQLALLQQLTLKITAEVFADEPPIIIGTGGFASLFENEEIFSVIIPDLVLHGLRLSIAMNY